MKSLCFYKTFDKTKSTSSGWFSCSNLNRLSNASIFLGWFKLKTFKSNTSTFIPRNCQKTNAHSRINRSRQGCSQILKNKNCESSYADISRRLVKRYVIKAQVLFKLKNHTFYKKSDKNIFLGWERTRKYKWRWNSRDKTGMAFHLGFLDYFRSHFQSHFWAYYWLTVRSSTSGLILNFSPEHHFTS